MSNNKQGKGSPVWGLIAMITVVAGIAVCYNAVKDVSVGDVLDEMGISDPPIPYAGEYAVDARRTSLTIVDPDAEGPNSVTALIFFTDGTMDVLLATDYDRPDTPIAELFDRAVRLATEEWGSDVMRVEVLAKVEDGVLIRDELWAAYWNGEFTKAPVTASDEPEPLPTCPDLAKQFYPGTCGLVDSINEGEPISDLDIIIGGLEQYQPYQSCGGSAEACLSP